MDDQPSRQSSPIMHDEPIAYRFVVFTGKRTARTSEPRASITRTGLICLNGPALDALGNPQAVELLFDQTQQILGLRPVDPAVVHAYPVTRDAKYRTGRVSIRALQSHYGLSKEPAVPLVRIEDGVLCVPLRSNVVTLADRTVAV